MIQVSSTVSLHAHAHTVHARMHTGSKGVTVRHMSSFCSKVPAELTLTKVSVKCNCRDWSWAAACTCIKCQWNLRRALQSVYTAHIIHICLPTYVLLVTITQNNISTSNIVPNFTGPPRDSVCQAKQRAPIDCSHVWPNSCCAPVSISLLL